MAKVYVSSTVADLTEERRAVLEWLRLARHQAVDSYLPDSDTVRDSCLDDVAACDLYVLIVGHRYGFQPPEGNPEGLSITQLEFRRAGQCGIPRVALLRTSIPDVRLSDLQDPARAPRLLSRIGPRSRRLVAWSMARPTAGGSGTWTTLVPLPHTRSTRWPYSSPRSPMSALVASKIRKPSRPSMATSAKSYRLGDSRAAVSRAPNYRCVNPRVGDPAGTAGRRTCSAGECSSTPSRTQVR